MTRSLKIYVGRDLSPVQTHTNRIEWPRMELANGGIRPTSSRIIIRDEDGEYGPEVGSQNFLLGYHNVVEVIEDAPGSDTMLFRGRIEVVDTSRGEEVPQKINTFREHTITVSDYNRDLYGIVVDREERPNETDVARVNWLLNNYLSGDPRPSTNLGGSFISSSNTILLGSNTYSGMAPFDVLDDIASQTDKVFFVDVDGELHYDGHDSTAFLSTLRISDRLADLDGNTFHPDWVAGTAIHQEGMEVLSALRSYWGPDGSDRTVQVSNSSTRYDYWESSFFDSISITSDQAERRARGELQIASVGHNTITCQIGPIPANRVDEIKAGQRIQVKAQVLPTAATVFRWIPIVELRWKPISGDPTNYLAILELERPKKYRGRGSNGPTGPGAAVQPEPPPVCETPEEAGLPAGSISADWRSGNPTRVDPLLGGGATYPWGHIGQTSGGACPGNFTRVDGNEESQWFGVTAGTEVAVSISSVKIGGPTTTGARITFADVGGSPISTSSQSFWSGWSNDVTCVPVVNTFTYTVPVGAVYASFAIGVHSVVHYIFAGTVVTPEDECEPHSVDPDGFPNDGDGEESDNDSPFFLRSDSPLLTATDQHVTTRLSRDMDNSSGGDLEAGAVVIATGQDEFDTTTTASYDDGMVGILREDTADGATGNVKWIGMGGQIPTFTGSVTTGDYIYTSTTAGKATTSGTRSAGAVGRVILATSGTANFIEWWGVPDEVGAAPAAENGATHRDVSVMHRYPLWAHRGDIGSSDSYPEQTIEALRQAILKGADGVECDFWPSSEGTFYSMHDASVSRTTDGSGDVSSKTDAQMDALVIDAGFGYDAGRHGALNLHPPTLAAVVEALRPYDAVLKAQVKFTTQADIERFAQEIIDLDYVSHTIIEVNTDTQEAYVKGVSAALTTMFNGAADGDADWGSYEASGITNLAYSTSRAPTRIGAYVSIADYGSDESTWFQNAYDRGASSFQTNNLDAALALRQALIYGGGTAAEDHIADTTDAHDASAISIVDTGGYFTGTQVEAALQELGASVASVVGHYEVIVSGSAPPVAVTNIAEDDWLYGFVPD